MAKRDNTTFLLIGGACALAGVAYWWLSRGPGYPQTTDTQSEAGTLPTKPNPYDQLNNAQVHPLEDPSFFDSLKAIIRPI